MPNKNHILVTISLTLIIVAFAFEPIPQDPRYHDFADQRTVLGVPNGNNVLSNIFFLIPGAWGILFVLSLTKKGSGTILLLQYGLFFAGVFLSGLGSSYYHLNPSNSSLFWDRLPMSMAFMALFSSVIYETVSRRAGTFLLVPLLLIGVLSVAYWSWTESAGRGDLRLYAVVQFLPVILIPLILILYKPARNYTVPIGLLAISYLISKIFEVFDTLIYLKTAFVSGHTLKHFFAAGGTLFILKMLCDRKKEFT